MQGAGFFVGGEPIKWSSGLPQSLQRSGSQGNQDWLASQGGKRAPSRKNQTETPRRHKNFNHAGQAGQGADGLGVVA